MGDRRRPLTSFTSGDFDFPPATSIINASSPVEAAGLDGTRRGSQGTGEPARLADDTTATERYSRWPYSSRPGRRRIRDMDIMNPPLSQENTQSPLPGNLSEAEEGRRRGAKRRKLHHTEPEAAFQYGHYGQVEAGRLRLGLESCDGEIHAANRGSIYYGPENILKHDKSVYCTRNAECNILLRHHDLSPFTLEKLYIIAPENGFTAPLKEGSVYIAMDRESLLPYLQRTNQKDHDSVGLSLLESLHDPEVSRALFQPRGWSPLDSGDQTIATPESEDLENPWTMTRHVTRSVMEPYRQPTHQTFDLNGCDEHTHDASEQDIQVAVLTDDELHWPEDPTNAAVLADRQRRQRHMANVDDDNYGWDSRFRSVHSSLQRGRRSITQRQEREAPMVTPHSDGSGHDGVIQARFKIKEGKHKVAIRFEPAVSGTHILLKLQTPSIGKNIDIQTVIASGYAGPRFFPAVQLR